MKCKDCGAREFTPSDIRQDVCAECMDLRKRLIQGLESGKVSVDEFESVQRAMNGDLFRHGRGAKKMRKVLGEPS